MVRRISGKGFVIVTVLAMALSPFWAGQAGAQRYTPADTDGLIARLGDTDAAVRLAAVEGDAAFIPKARLSTQTLLQALR